MISGPTRYQGGAVTWMAAGGTYVITLAGINSTQARAGAVGDLAVRLANRDRFPKRIAVEVVTEFAVAPVAGTTVELWWAPSKDGLIFPGGVTGVDEDWQAASEAEFKVQLMHVGSVVNSADVQPVAQIGNFVFEPPYRYGCPVLVNLGGQAMVNDDNEHRITFTPILDESH